ncbi:MAG: helix-turn-helix transcriptional regulator [Spirochaetes bacterium]|nr:helix-turn-helix transcriptional regulator [Spirochaetota bacterium]
MKLSILVIENGINNINHFKKVFKPEYAEIYYADSFLDVFDAILENKAAIILLSDYKGKILTSEYIKTLILANPDIKLLILTDIKIINQYQKYYYIQRGADDVIERRNIKTLLNKLKFYYSIMLEKRKTKNKCDAVTKQIITFLTLNYNTSCNVKKLLSQKFSVSMSFIYHNFKKNTGISVGKWLRSIKINKAKELLINTKMPVKKIYKELGFKTVQGFIKMFKKETGNNPIEYRKKVKF